MIVLGPSWCYNHKTNFGPNSATTRADSKLCRVVATVEFSSCSLGAPQEWSLAGKPRGKQLVLFNWGLWLVRSLANQRGTGDVCSFCCMLAQNWCDEMPYLVWVKASSWFLNYSLTSWDCRVAAAYVKGHQTYSQLLSLLRGTLWLPPAVCCSVASCKGLLGC